jgi:hypothetical protein
MAGFLFSPPFQGRDDFVHERRRLRLGHDPNLLHNAAHLSIMPWMLMSGSVNAPLKAVMAVVVDPLSLTC